VNRAILLAVASDPFQVLGVPQRYEVDRAGLHRAYLRRSAELHPDSVGGAGADDDGIAELNAARSELEDPLRRAMALLEVLSARSVERRVPADDRALPDGFLMEMMELREQIEADLAQGDSVLLARWEQWGMDQRAHYEHTVGAMFASVADGAQAPASTLRSIRKELNAWRYIERMLEQLHTPPQM
jgi:molecular chaperone HscB